MMRGERGATLLVVTLLLAGAVAVAAGLAPTVLRAVEQGERETTRNRIDEIEAGLLDYYRDRRTLPAALDALVTASGGPYVEPRDVVGRWTDGRGAALSYTATGASATISSTTFPELGRAVSVAEVDLAWRRRAAEELDRIASVCAAWRDENGTFPAGIEVLVPGRLGGDYALDPWGSVYEIEGGQVASAGPDRLVGTADDLVRTP